MRENVHISKYMTDFETMLRFCSAVEKCTDISWWRPSMARGGYDTMERI